MKKLWTVKEVCAQTGLTGKHLHFYHHAGVVRAAKYANYSVEGHDGYKLYDDAGLAKLQQISMYYELGLKRNEIRGLMMAPGYDMHQALDDLRVQMEEKRLRLERHIAAIEQLRLIGTKNNLMDIFRQFSLDGLGKNALAYSQEAIDQWVESVFDEQSFETFFNQFEKHLGALSGLEPDALASEPGTIIVGKTFQDAIQTLGLPGYLLVLSLFLSAAGEGEMAKSFDEELSLKISPEQGKAAIVWLRNDLNQLLEETARLIARHHDVLGKPFDSPGVAEMIAGLKELLRLHFGILHNEEYSLYFNALEFPPYEGNQDYLNYLLGALKYYVEIC